MARTTGCASTATRRGRRSTTPTRWASPLGVPRCATREDDRDLLNEDAIWKILNHQGITTDDVEILGFACWAATMSGSPTGGGSAGCSLAGDAAPHAAVDRPGHAPGARRRQPVLEAAGRAVRDRSEAVLDTYQAERLPHVRRSPNRAVKVGKVIVDRHPCTGRGAPTRLPHREQSCPASAPGCRNSQWLLPATMGPACWRNGNPAVGLADPQPLDDRRRRRPGAVRRHRRQPLDRCCTPAPTRPPAGRGVGRRHRCSGSPGRAAPRGRPVRRPRRHAAAGGSRTRRRR